MSKAVKMIVVKNDSGHTNNVLALNDVDADVQIDDIIIYLYAYATYSNAFDTDLTEDKNFTRLRYGKVLEIQDVSPYIELDGYLIAAPRDMKVLQTKKKYQEVHQIQKELAQTRKNLTDNDILELLSQLHEPTMQLLNEFNDLNTPKVRSTTKPKTTTKKKETLRTSGLNNKN